MKRIRAVIFLFLFIQVLIYAQVSSNNPLDNLIVVEAENCTDLNGIPASGPKGKTSPVLFFNSNNNASNNGFISSYPSPFRTYANLKEPAIATTTIEIPESGIWYVHFRYYVTPENIRKLLSSPKPPGHFRFFKPFKVIIGGNEFLCGKNQEPGEEFRWDSFSANLKAGKNQVKFIMDDLSGPDCIVLTKTPDYTPEPSDYEGPLWFRFKVLKSPSSEFYIYCRINFNPYESKTPLDFWLFKDKIATSIQEKDAIIKTGNQYLSKGQWSLWIKTVNPKRAYCSMNVMVMPSDLKAFPEARRSGLNDIEVVFQAATRPDERFLIHQANEYSGRSRGIYILLPHEPGLSGIRKWTKSFSEWAEERLKLVKQTGAKEGEGPEKIQVFTDARAYTERDIDAIIESCRLAGFNGFDLDFQQNLMSETELWIKIKDAGFKWTVAHHLLINIDPEWEKLSKIATDNMQETVEKQFYEKARERILKLTGSRSEIRRKMLDLAILADEPNPQPHYLFINHIPALRQCFHEFLKNNSLKPGFFGKKNWDEVDAIGYSRRTSSSIEKVLENFGVKIVWKKSGEAEKDEEVERATDISDQQKQEKDQAKNLKTVEVNLYTGTVKASFEEKKLYYWTQKFRSFYTRRIYGTGASVVKELAESGWLKKDIKISPNFQAAPMMEVRMWDGALNLFEWARNNTTNFLLCEDWINDPYRVAFGFSLLQAAARKNNQELGYLIVVDANFRRRYLAGLANGASLFIDYHYGPMFTKGPAWSSSPEYTKDWCEMLRWTKRCENDILNTKPKKSDVALLIANSSEICSVFYSATNYETGLSGRAFESRPLFRRAGIYAALLDANIPVDIVSEEEIIEDDILKNYKVLYVVDTHVREDAQKKIKEWVRDGGTLWADYIAIARNQYDQDTDTFNDVFGLQKRGYLPDPEKILQAKENIIKVYKGDWLEEVEFMGSLFKPQWKLSTGKILGVFEDGAPAIVYNRYGKGNAIIVGCSSLIFSPYIIQCNTHPEFDKVRRVVSLATEIAGIKKHCIINVTRINSFIREGENRKVLFLINSTGKEQECQIKFECDKKILDAFDARGNKIDFIQENDEVIFSRKIKENDGDICIFRW